MIMDEHTKACLQAILDGKQMQLLTSGGWCDFDAITVLRRMGLGGRELNNVRYQASVVQDETVFRFWWPATKSRRGCWSRGCEKTDSPERAGKVARIKVRYSQSSIQYLPRPAHWPDAYGNLPKGDSK